MSQSLHWHYIRVISYQMMVKVFVCLPTPPRQTVLLSHKASKLSYTSIILFSGFNTIHGETQRPLQDMQTPVSGTRAPSVRTPTQGLVRSLHAISDHSLHVESREGQSTSMSESAKVHELRLSKYCFRINSQQILYAFKHLLINLTPVLRAFFVWILFYSFDQV